jgi:hypothetical protein
MQTGQQPPQMAAMMGGGFGGGGGGGGRGGAGAGGFQDRPGETRALPSFGAQGGGRGGAGGGPGGAAPGGEGAPEAAAGPAGLQAVFGPLREALGDDFAAIGILPGGGGGGRGRRGGQNTLAGTGDYKITIIVGGTSYSKVLRIERVSGGEGGGGFFGLDDEGRKPNDR